jgi:CYTH domain-containing protein
VATEIERKFLVRRDVWRADSARGTAYRQGYLSDDPARTVRVRLAGAKATLTIKGVTRGIERAEFEYEIPPEDAVVLLETLCIRPLIEKTRYRLDHGGRTWEVDVFAGDNAGLIVAEIELPSADAQLELPPWVGAEVSDDARYFNSNLAKHPYTTWAPR